MTSLPGSVLIGKLSDSNLRVRVSVVVSVLLFGSFEFLVCWTMRELSLTHTAQDLLQSALVGSAAGIGVWVLLVGWRERRKLLASEIERLAELNHTVRNSLNVIALVAHSIDEHQKQIVIDSTNRIDEKLRELFPVVGIKH